MKTKQKTKEKKPWCPKCGAELPPGHPLRTGTRKNDGTKVQIFRKPPHKG